MKTAVNLNLFYFLVDMNDMGNCKDHCGPWIVPQVRCVCDSVRT